LSLRLEILDARVSVRGRWVVKGVSIGVGSGEVHVLMGPNGAGKSSLALGVMGHRDYKLVGKVLLDGDDVTNLSAHEKALRGLTIAVQQPPTLEGVRVGEILTRIASKFMGAHGVEAVRIVSSTLKLVGLDPSLVSREFMVEFSGGERKKLELARILLMKPKAVILDEPDSGVDLDSLPLIARGISKLAAAGAAVLLIPHQPRLLEYLVPDKVYVMMGGSIVSSGGPELARIVEENGYEYLLKVSSST